MTRAGDKPPTQLEVSPLDERALAAQWAAPSSSPELSRKLAASMSAIVTSLKRLSRLGLARKAGPDHCAPWIAVAEPRPQVELERAPRAVGPGRWLGGCTKCGATMPSLSQGFPASLVRPMSSIRGRPALRRFNRVRVGIAAVPVHGPNAQIAVVPDGLENSTQSGPSTVGASRLPSAGLSVHCRGSPDLPL
jgi:hypothetical protein